MGAAPELPAKGTGPFENSVIILIIFNGKAASID